MAQPDNGGPSVLVAGAINTDLVARAQRAPEAGETVTGGSFAIFGGGKGANQALGAARMGAETAILGAVGDDDFGRARLHDLRLEGVDTQSVLITRDAASGVALISVEASGQNRILYVPGATLTVPTDDAVSAVKRWQPRVVLTTLELPLDAIKAMLTTARGLGAITILNATPEPETGVDLLNFIDVLVVNEAEAIGILRAAHNEELVGSQPDWGAVAQVLSRLGPPSVIITLGAVGAVVLDDQRLTTIPASSVDVVDTTGAGDSLCGAVAALLAEGQSVVDATRVGVAAGTLATTVAGAQPSVPRRDAVMDFAQGSGAHG